MSWYFFPGVPQDQVSDTTWANSISVLKGFGTWEKKKKKKRNRKKGEKSREREREGEKEVGRKKERDPWRD